MDATQAHLLALAHNPWRFMAHVSASTSLPNVTFTKIALQQIDYDPNLNFDAVTNSRYTAPVTGYYTIKGNVTVPTTGTVTLPAIYVNGAINSDGEFAYGPSDWGRAQVQTIVFLNPGDYVELWCYQHSSGTQSSGIGPLDGWLSGYWMGT